MSMLMEWVSRQPQMSPFLSPQLSRVVHPEGDSLSKEWRSLMAHKVLVNRLSSHTDSSDRLDPNRTTILGGMCLVNTVEMKRIYSGEIKFASAADFGAWYASWYPRIDQIHDAVGIPPRTCKKIVYVSEDSFFAHRLAEYTGFDKVEIQKILRIVHERQGHVVLAQYLRAMGYSGDLTCMYTSDIEPKLETALRMWERLLNHKFRTCDRDFAKVELMYSGFWLDVLGITGPAVIYEAASKMILRGWVRLDPWFSTHPYRSQLNRDLGIVGYVPFLTTQGDGSKLSFDQVPNYHNNKSFRIAKEDVPWYVANLLFTKQSVVEHGPLSLDAGKATEMISNDLSQYYR